MRIIVASGLGLCSLALAVVGCNQQSNPLPAGPGVASTAAGITAPQGPYPRGAVDPAHLPTRQGPEIEALRPARGLHTPLAFADVEVQVRDPDGVATVTIAGAPAQPLGADRYGATVALAPGMNLIRTVATDGLGDASSGSFAVLRGELAAPGDLVSGAAHVRLGQPALDEAARRIEAAASTLDLLSAVRAAVGSPLLRTSVLTVDLTAITHAPPRVATLTGYPGGVALALELDALRVELDVNLVGHGLVHVTADRARVEATAAFRPAAGPATGARLLGVELDRVAVRFDALQLRAANALVDAVLSPFKGLILGALQQALDRAVQRAAPTLLARPLAGVDAPLVAQAPLLDGSRAPLGILARIEGGQGWVGVGLDLTAALSVSALAPVMTASVIVTRPALPAGALPASDHVGVALSVDAANAFANAYWASGAGRYTVDGTQVRNGKRPAAARLLYPFFPVARDLAPDPATPIVIEASLEAPPLVRLAGGRVTLLLPEAQLSLFIDYMDGGPRAELLRVRLSLEATVRLDAQGTELVLSDLQAAQLGADVIAEPSADLDDQGVEAFLVAALPEVLKAVQLPRIPVPALPAGIPLLAPTVSVLDGFAVVRAQVR